MILRSITKHVRDQNWFAVGLDFLIVVVGVFIGIQVANWNEVRLERQVESVYLSDLQQDFERNLDLLEEREQSLTGIIDAMQELLAETRLAQPQRSVPELNDLFNEVLAMPTFHWVSRTYENLTGSGELRLIRSRPIQSALAEAHRTMQVIGMVQATHEQQ